MLLLFFLLFNTFYPAFLVLFLFLILYESLITLHFKEENHQNIPWDFNLPIKWKNFFPFLWIFFCVLPFAWYFEIFKIYIKKITNQIL